MQVFNPNDPNVAMLEHVARSLGPELCSQLVFVGGAAAGLLITDLAMPPIRRTENVTSSPTPKPWPTITALRISFETWALCKTKAPMHPCAVGA